MKYGVALAKAAKRDLQRLEKETQRRVANQLQILSETPRPPGVIKLRGAENEWRFRVGDYRIIYEIDDGEHLITVLRIRHRREVYR